jgi:hypothetical protein
MGRVSLGLLEPVLTLIAMPRSVNRIALHRNNQRRFLSA